MWYGKKEPTHSFAPEVREHFFINFIIEGSCIFHTDGKSYKLKKNQGFVVFPDVITHYEVDNKKIWMYYWVEFKGINAKNYLKLARIDDKKPIFQCEEETFIKNCFQDIINVSKIKEGKNLRSHNLLEVLLWGLIEKSSKEISMESNYKDIYIEKTQQFIENNYYMNISVTEMSENIGLSKNYFSSFFKKHWGITPQEYLINFRIDKACELLEDSTLIIGDIAHSVGYIDALGFSKMFKKIKGVSPRNYRNGVKRQ
ncbi:AraC family transcriptional regulator [Clostridium akagii]|uniref:AraC family transcriptional regulator n=1 Tax=Clostridium akagii TaxID=91623 RepID=UPI000A8244FF|nr:AraC family transcriptional regulator [Clostridium akagii]